MEVIVVFLMYIISVEVIDFKKLLDKIVNEVKEEE